MDFTDQEMDEANIGLEKIYTLLGRIEEKIGLSSDFGDHSLGEYWELFCEAMDDDFNTARGIGTLFVAVRDLNRVLDKDDFSLESKKKIASGRADILKMGGI